VRAPVRIQLSRRKGWRMPPGTMKVDRTTALGNPFTPFGCAEAGYIGTAKALAQRCVEAFRVWADTLYWRNNWDGPESEAARTKLLARLPDAKGKDLACWCHLCPAHKDGKPMGTQCPDCAPCHADVLLELANASPPQNGGE